ncbi:TVP38/TMEM64 family protein (plasmid) [Rhodococcus pyridinivorans]|uniref:TVP38/TMEM64 family protein n=1 Tax=Rhodococcus pyridinivorans TaxID=103816 RepID=UPI0020C69281|nr:TVP38/TMEM64 family protein [Rhodococcus pyridinivorans]UTM40036.1 TVP38/TMEM64 family protein [Rhodococcus pyridinivorans]
MLTRRTVLAAGAVVAAVMIAVTVVPYPSITQMREWAASVGPEFVLLFFLAQVVVTVTPIPRTVFTLSAGVLFGPAVGLVVTIAATTVSAMAAFMVVRALGRGAVRTRLSHPRALAVDERLARRGWIAVGSLRLIAIVPFAVVNYCCALSSVRLLPYIGATVAGILPGTLGVVLLGEALTGRTNPALMTVTTVCLLLGAAGLLIEIRRPAATAPTQDSRCAEIERHHPPAKAVTIP